MGEQDNGRNHAGASDSQAAEGVPTEDGAGTAVSGSSVHRGARSVGAELAAGRAVQKIMDVLAAIVRLVGS